MSSSILRKLLPDLFVSVFAAAVTCVPAAAQQQQKTNIVIIWGDDIGQSNVSAYSRGMMGYKTPNIDRVASEGVLFTDYYAEQSCTAGRSSFITGQSGLRTGMTKVGLPGATLEKIRQSLNCSSRSGIPADSLARTILATATNSYPLCMASTSSTAIFIT